MPDMLPAVLFCLLSLLLTVPTWAQRPDISEPVELRIEPSRPLIEKRGCQQLLNFDLAATNKGTSTLKLVDIEMDLYGIAGELTQRKTLNSNGLAPGIDTVEASTLRPGETADLFNPFYAISDKIDIGHLDFAFRYVREDNIEQREANRHRSLMDYDVEARVTVHPVSYKSETDLALPLHGRLLVWEGHDFYAHHRRIPLDNPRVEKLGIRANANRYADDFVIVDEQGQMHRGNAFDKKSYYVYDAPIYAPGAGTVVKSENAVPDNEFVGKTIKYPNLPPGIDDSVGNYVLIDHGDGEFSVLPHMLAGSVLVNVGRKVKQGDVIGRVGFSGDAIFPHVHYSLISAADPYQAEGLPPYFQKFCRAEGNTFVRVDKGTVDSGDLLEFTSGDSFGCR